MAPSVKPAARLSERPFCVAEASVLRPRSGHSRVSRSRACVLRASRVSPALRRAGGGTATPSRRRLPTEARCVGDLGEGHGEAGGGCVAAMCAASVARTREPTGPQIRRDDPLNLSISISGGKETNQDSPSNGERSGKSSSRQSLVLIASELWPVEASVPDATSSKLTWKGTSERVIAPCVAKSRRAATVFGESGCLGVQPKVGGKLHLKPNNGTRPIANKYHEGKVKSTLERELKRPRNRWEGNACSRTGPRRVQGAARRSACSRHLGSAVRGGVSRPCTLGVVGRPSTVGGGRRARVGQVALPLAAANLQPIVRSARHPPRRAVAFPPV